MNNKGFAITAVLYGLLILFVILVSSYLTVLSVRKNRVDNLIIDLENDYKKSFDFNTFILKNDNTNQEEDVEIYFSISKNGWFDSKMIPIDKINPPTCKDNKKFDGYQIKYLSCSQSAFSNCNVEYIDIIGSDGQFSVKDRRNIEIIRENLLANGYQDSQIEKIELYANCIKNGDPTI